MYDETTGDLLKRTENAKAFFLDVSKLADAPVELVMYQGK